MKKDVCKNCLLRTSLHLAQLLMGKFIKEVLQTNEREKNTPAHHWVIKRSTYAKPYKVKFVFS